MAPSVPAYELDEGPDGRVWGEDPAREFDEAVDRIRAMFSNAVGREPRREELIAGLLVSIDPLSRDGLLSPDLRDLRKAVAVL